MSRFIHKTIITILACFIFSLIVISLVSYKIYIKENERIHLNQNKISLFNIEKNSLNLLSEKKINEIQLNKINETSIFENIDDDSVKNLENKMRLEKYFILNIQKNWKKPFNYKEGQSCSINIYYKSNKIKYNINECTENNSILKRSFEVPLIKIIEDLKPSDFKIYNYKNRIHINIS